MWVIFSMKLCVSEQSLPSYSTYLGSGYLSDLSQNVVDALSCRHQSFRQVWYKLTVDCVGNANKCQKIPYSVMVKKTKKWPGIRTRIQITIKSQWLLEGPSPVAHTCQVWSTSVSALSVILFTEWHNQWQTERSHNLRLIVGGNKRGVTSHCSVCSKWYLRSRAVAVTGVNLTSVSSS